jgi:hypothetical protein
MIMQKIRSSRFQGVARISGAVAASLVLGHAVFGEEATPEPSPLLKAPAITLQSGDLTVKMRPSTAWTFSEIAYKGNVLTTPSSFSGLVLNFGGAKFLGSGHKEAGGQENVLSIQLSVDGKFVDALKGGTVSGETVELVKESKLFTTHLKSVLRLTGGTLECEQFLTPSEDVPLDLMYAFMFPWNLQTTQWLAKTTKDTIREGDFTSADKSWELLDNVRWAAIYNPVFKVAAVTIYADNSQTGANIKHGFWNVHAAYHKQYFQPLSKTTLEKDKTYHWQVKLLFVEADAENWKTAVQTKTEELSKKAE